MSEFPYELRCKHFLIPEQCDLCLTAYDQHHQVEPHVAARIAEFRATRFTAMQQHVEEKRIAARLRRQPPRKISARARRNMGRRPALREAKEIAPKRTRVITPVFGYGFDPHSQKNSVASGAPTHLQTNA